MHQPDRPPSAPFRRIRPALSLGGFDGIVWDRNNGYRGKKKDSDLIIDHHKRKFIDSRSQ
jgi:hypothetical protein